jgi:asparagine synthase (glutamine-hydrolysing)
MCGITFKYSTNHSPLDISFRGPDSSTIYQQGKLWCRFDRLVVVNRGISNQPYMKDNALLLCNGEIYNCDQLYDNSEMGDCYCILHSYLEKRVLTPEIVNALDGVFAFLIYDDQKIHLCRDRTGVRPLYYGFPKEGGIVVSSLSFGSSFRMKQVPPRQILTIDCETLQVNSVEYTQYCIELNPPTNYFCIFVKELGKKIYQAVQKRTLHTHRKFGCLLSGGLDSSIVAYVLAQIGVEFETFTIGHTDSMDVVHAREMATFLKTKHHEVPLPPLNVELIIEIIKTLGTYDVTTIRASIPMYWICKYIKEHTDIVILFSGEGADEIFGGYRYFRNAPSCNEFQEECVRLVRDLHYFDVLRADRCVSAHGLELRVPFLDKDLVDFVLYQIPTKYKAPAQVYHNGFCDGYGEKGILRSVFSDTNFPQTILKRDKDGFSDSVSSSKQNWSDEIRKVIGVDSYEDEQTYYKNAYDKLGFQEILPYQWQPRWTLEKDPSGRKIM